MSRVAQDAIKSDYGWFDGVAVDDTPTLLAPGNMKRIQARAQPLGADIFVGFDDQLTVATGTLVVNGSQAIEDVYCGPLYAICRTGETADVRVQEVL